jgi:LPS export ABC transporter protein LptC
MALNINLFFILIATLLLSILFFLRPMNVTTTEHGEIAQLELKKFKLYEVTDKGIKTEVNAAVAKRFENRYETQDIYLIDNSRNSVETMQAKEGIYYNNEMIYLDGDVFYHDSKGVQFYTQKIEYNQSKSTVFTPNTFEIIQYKNKVFGKELHYDNNKKVIKAKNISANYFLDDNLTQ